MAFISIELDLPDHTKELTDTTEYIKKIKKDIQNCKSTKAMSKRDYASLYERITRGLYYVGSLSVSAFDVEDKIQEEYFKVYRHAPELAKKLWQEHYGNVHKPYTILKNRLYRIYQDLDEMYMRINKSTVPMS